MMTETTSRDGKVLADPREGERGAIMVMGVFLACSMIAAMWYVMGIGDAILWRDRSQEAADSMSYTSAAIHARGMNFIAMCNIIMLLLVGIYLLMCLIRTVLDLILYITGDPTNIECIPPSLNKDTKGHSLINLTTFIVEFFTAGGNVPRYGDSFFDTIGNLAGGLVDNAAGRDWIVNADCTIAVSLCCAANHPFEDVAEPVAKGYVWLEKAINVAQKVMDKALPLLHGLEVETAQLNPWIAAGASAFAAAQYFEQVTGDKTNIARHYGIAMSPSMFRKLKKPQKEKRLKNIPDGDYIKYTGNGCGPTLCNDTKVSRSGGKTPDGDCCDKCGGGGCSCSGVCSSHGGINPDQSGLYEEVTIDDSKDYRIGLPVQAENMNELCKKAFVFLGEGIMAMLQSIPGVGQAMSLSIPGLPSLSDLMQKLFNGMGDWFKKAYCLYEPSFSANHSKSYNYMDDVPADWKDKKDPAATFWAINETDPCPFASWHPTLKDHGGGNGPMIMAPYAPNGNDYEQVYGVIVNTKYNPMVGEYGTANNETAWSKISLAVGPKEWNKSTYTEQGQDVAGLKGNGPLFYIAQAEFYHDCDATWDDLACNGADHAVYRLNWRTRLRRVFKPVYIQELTNKIPSGIGKAAGFLTKNQWALNYLLSDYTGDLGNVFNAVELLTDLAGPDQRMQYVIH